MKQHEECFNEQFVTYQAQSYSLPGTFDDGRTGLGSYDSVRLEELDTGKHIEIYIRYIDTTLIIRQIGHYLTFSARMPDEFVNKHLTSGPGRMQLCSAGCPSLELIDHTSYIAQQKKRTRLKNFAPDGKRSESASTNKETVNSDSLANQGDAPVVSANGLTREEAATKCRAVGVVEFYFQSCVFDLLTTADTKFTVAAYYALHDVIRLTPALQPETNATSFENIDRLYANLASSVYGNRQPHWPTVLTLLCIVLNLSTNCFSLSR